MTDELNQMLSSVMDAAGDDLELPRLLNAMQEPNAEGQALRDKWRRYHLAQGILHGELRSTDARVASVDISAAVMARLEAEPAVAAIPLKMAASGDGHASWWRGGALAASVALLVIAGVQVFNVGRDSLQSDAPLAVQQVPASIQPVTVVAQPLALQPTPANVLTARSFTGMSLVSAATGHSRSSAAVKPDQASDEQAPPLLLTPVENPAR